MNKIDFLISPQTKEFVKLCRRYFEYLEKLPDRKITDFWDMQLRLLPEIYTGIFQLPVIDARYASDVEKFVTERTYNKIYTGMVAYIGALDKFSDFSDLSHPGTVKVVEASLSEMLTDIYQELKDFVLLYETGTLENMNDAIADCFDTFGQYWGVKLLTATRIIHVNLYQHRYAEAKKASQLDEEVEDEMSEEYDEEEME
ncbi:MAG: DUF5063 domain-containing protein [Bacteroidales bacterium]|jgi:hypothetical protein|nr:DUF5063 domain-containing protein [Bacteroidales bacterium]